jgi:hypothetical protein
LPAERRTTAHPLANADPQITGAWMVTTCGAGAAAEALFRAFLGEHDGDRPAAQFWLEVYRIVVAAERAAFSPD